MVFRITSCELRPLALLAKLELFVLTHRYLQVSWSQQPSRQRAVHRSDGD